MQAFKDVLLPQLMHDLEEDILIRSDDCFGGLVGTIEQFFCDFHNIVNWIFVVLKEGKCERSKSIVERKAIVGNDHPFPIVDDRSLLDESSNHIEIATLSISPVIFSHFR